MHESGAMHEGGGYARDNFWKAQFNGIPPVAKNTGFNFEYAVINIEGYTPLLDVKIVD